MPSGVGPSGLLVLDKPSGMTSHDVVGRVRRVLGTRKVGHAGTLDPMATGVLLIGVGRATRLLGHFALADKAYAATIRLGQSTVTDDAEGEIAIVSPAKAVQALDEVDITDGLARLTGTIQQRPSAVSAIKVDGRRAYDRVRSGEDVELAARTVVISRIEVGEIGWQPDSVDVDVRVECSTGTYVRAIARDLGEDLGVGGHLVALRRTRVGPFGIDEAVDLPGLDDAGAGVLLPLSVVGRRCFPLWWVDEATAQQVRHGVRVPWAGPASDGGATALVAADGDLLALAEEDDGRARYLVVFPGD
ncbi:MAG: tRNA pseudouridine(55) synthase TruB [Actinomycetales bacterium]|nr:tRNA pseudouridine(55) synthase TruB [Actinomycetales bacterium]